MGEMNHQPGVPPPVGVPPPMGMQPMMNAPVGAGAMHQPYEQFNQLNYCVHSNPSWVQVAGLAFLHYLVMLGSTVMLVSIIVPAMGGGPGEKARVIQAFLFVSGINTLLQTLVGTRLPTVMNASFAFVVPVLSIARQFNTNDFESNHERFVHTMRATQGALIVASILNMILGYSRAWGAFAKKFSPVIMTPVVCVVGLGLFQIGFPQVGKCVEIGLPMLILAIVVQQYAPLYFRHIHERTTFLFERYSLLLCIGIVWAFAAILTAAGAYNHVSLKTQQHCRTDKSFLISSAPWIKISYPFHWGPPIFTAGHSFGMMGAVLVSSFESTGAHFATARLAGATPPPAHVLTRSIGLQGIGIFLAGLCGAPAGSSVSVENIGLLGLTKVGSRRVIQISTGFMIFFSIFGNSLFPPCVTEGKKSKFWLKFGNFHSCREVWGVLRINPVANLRSNLLHLVWYRSCCGNLVQPVCKQKLHEEHLHHWTILVPWHLDPSIFRRVHRFCWPRTCPNKCRMVQ
uniref:Nucleobase-ascorbate transporter 3 n=1 Tax=Aegilops tauschii subsp. strangulata TaxID=200361 RepID=A0A453JUT9_AEGTS